MQGHKVALALLIGWSCLASFYIGRSHTRIERLEKTLINNAYWEIMDRWPNVPHDADKPYPPLDRLAERWSISRQELEDVFSEMSWHGTLVPE